MGLRFDVAIIGETGVSWMVGNEFGEEEISSADELTALHALLMGYSADAFGRRRATAGGRRILTWGRDT